MNKFIFPLAITLASAGSLLSANDNPWNYLFQDATYEDFYYDFLEPTEPEEVFEFTADGTLVIKGEDHSIGYIQTLDEYENFEIEFEWRWPDEPGKSGIQLHSTSDTSFSIWPECIEVQLAEDETGDFWLLNTQLEVTEDQMPKKAAERNRRHRLKVDIRSKFDEFGKPKKELEKEAGEWNTMHIVSREDTIKVYLNDALVNEGTEASRTAGYITLQAEESNLEIRNFRIRDLDMSEATPPTPTELRPR